MDTEATQITVDDLVNSDLRPYRVGALQGLSESGRVDLTVWHGNAAPGMGAPESRVADLPVQQRSIRNLFWRRGQLRVLWQRGALGILTSPSQVVVCAEVIHNLTIWMIAALHRVFGKRLVLRGYFYRPGSEKWVNRLARRFLHRLADAYITYTDRGRDWLVAEGVSADRVFVSQNTLDTEALMVLASETTDLQVAELKAELGLTEAHVLLYLGRLLPVKRVSVAVETIGQLKDTCLVVVGDGFLRDELEASAEGLPVRFAGAVYDESELAVYFKMADLLLLPGRVGLTCVHGFANGVPCITTDESVVEQSPEYDYIEDGVNGLILPDDRPETFATAIRELLADDSRRERLCRGARDTAFSLGMATMVAEYEKAVFRALRG